MVAPVSAALHCCDLVLHTYLDHVIYSRAMQKKTEQPLAPLLTAVRMISWSCTFFRHASHRFPIRRAILNYIEQELRPDTTDSKGVRPSAMVPSAMAAMAPPVGPIVIVTTTRVSEPIKEAERLKTTLRPTLSTTRPGLPTGRRKNKGTKQINRPKFQLTPASRFGTQRSHVAELSAGRASSKSNSSSRSKESGGRVGRMGLARGADVGCRSVGTVVAHMPTAAAATKSKARERKATRRAWG